MAKRRRLVLTAGQRRELAAHRDHDPRPYVRGVRPVNCIYSLGGSAPMMEQL